MTSIYFVRHAEPDHDWEDDRTRPLTREGLEDRMKVLEVLKDIKIDCYFSSPYKRSFDTIKECAKFHGMEITSDERFRERRRGLNSDVDGMLQKRWSDFNFHEQDGEPLGVIQKQNIEVLKEVLKKHSGQNIVIGTHGTALSTIINYFYPSYSCDDFLRIIDYMPYIIRLDFDGTNCIGKEELLIIKKEYKGKKRADKR